MSLLPVGVHFDVPESVYRADPGLNQSALVKFMQKDSPLHYLEQSDDDQEELSTKDFIRIGNYADCALTRPAELEGRFVIAPETYPGTSGRGKAKFTVQKPWTWRAKYCQDWRAEVIEEGKDYLSQKELARGKATVAAVMAHQDASQFVKISQKQVVVIAEHPVNGLRMKCMLDLFPPENTGCLVDIKSAASAGRRHALRMSLTKRRDIQAKFYMDAVYFATGRLSQRFVFIMAETCKPHGVKLYCYNRVENGVEPPEMVKARKDYEKAMVQMAKCIETQKWPGFSNDWEVIRHPSWATRDEVQPDILVD